MARIFCKHCKTQTPLANMDFGIEGTMDERFWYTVMDAMYNAEDDYGMRKVKYKQFYCSPLCYVLHHNKNFDQVHFARKNQRQFKNWFDQQGNLPKADWAKIDRRWCEFDGTFLHISED